VHYCVYKQSMMEALADMRRVVAEYRLSRCSRTLLFLTKGVLLAVSRSSCVGRMIARGRSVILKVLLVVDTSKEASSVVKNDNVTI
jgi:hypothetical protein